MKTLLQKLTTSLFALVVAVMLMPSSDADAQYCDYDNMRWWYQYVIVDDVVVTDLTEGQVVLERLDTGYERWADISETDGPYEFNIGNDFLLEVTWSGRYGNYLFAYLDRNDDQRWEVDRMGPKEEYIGRRYRYFDWRNPYTTEYTEEFEFTVDDDTPEGPSVMRLKTNRYSFPDPCSMSFNPDPRWADRAYGEAEDYAINFVAPIPETFPTNGNILFNNQRYDGTERMHSGELKMFRLPSVEFKNAQPTGTKYMYSISGPVPSEEVVYTALDPITGSAEVEIRSTETVITAESAIGSASVSTDEGTFLPTKGGIYKVHVTLIKASGKRAEGINVFTVANEYDMSVAGVVSPRTSRSPRFFKYLVSTPIEITCLVQNTGLNPVSKFDVMAKIYDADTDKLIETLPTYTYDAVNDPALLPVQSTDTREITFPPFEDDNVGEYYIEFEVDYKFDEEEFNNHLPREGTSNHFFEIQYNDQLSAGEFVTPNEGDTLKVNKPYNANVLFENNGISDASNINFRMVVTNESGDEVYSGASFLEDLPQGRYNERVVKFPTLLLSEEGTYQACAWVDYLNDEVNSDDTVCVSFYVEKGIQDTITVGETNSLSEEVNDEIASNENPTDDNNKVMVENVELFTFTNITPNPANTTTRLDFTNETKEELTIEVVDMNGNIVSQNKSSNLTFDLDVTELSSGIYTVVVRSGNTLQTRQLNVVK